MMPRLKVTYFWYAADWYSIEPKRWDHLVSKVYEERKVPMYFAALYGAKVVKWPPKHPSEWWVLDYPILSYSDVLDANRIRKEYRK